jgi:predicted transposase YdaD
LIFHYFLGCDRVYKINLLTTALLSRVASEVAKIEEQGQREEISNSTQILAGLRFNKNLIRQLFTGGIMRESVIYQEILEEGMQAEAVTLVLRQLTRRIGTVEPEVQEQIRELSTAQLEDLG